MSRKGRKTRHQGLNKYQRAAFRQGEQRVGREEIQELLQIVAQCRSRRSPTCGILFVPLSRASQHRRGLEGALSDA